MSKSIFGQDWFPAFGPGFGGQEALPEPQRAVQFEPKSLQKAVPPLEAEFVPLPSDLLTNLFMRSAMPRENEATLSESALKVIGENGNVRFEEFKRYQPGWDLGRGKPLSAHSVQILDAFLRTLPELSRFQPSLFLTHQGNLQIGWEDWLGGAVEVEFYPDRVEYFLESSNEETFVSLSAISPFVERIRQLIC